MGWVFVHTPGSRRFQRWAALWLLVSSVACGEPVPRVVVSGFVSDIFSGQPIAGARFCRWRAPREACAVTDAGGRVAMSLPAGSKEWLLVDHEVFVPVLIGVAPGTEDYQPPGELSLMPRDLQDLLAAQLGLQLDPERGLVILYVYQQPGGEGRAGATLSVEPDPEGTLGYVDDQGDMTLDATATGAPGIASWINIVPGDYVATVSHPDYACRPVLAIPESTPDTFALKILPDRITYVAVYCD